MVDTVLLATDGSQAAQHAERFGVALASRLQARRVGQGGAVIEGGLEGSGGPRSSRHSGLDWIDGLHRGGLDRPGNEVVPIVSGRSTPPVGSDPSIAVPADEPLNRLRG